SSDAAVRVAVADCRHCECDRCGVRNHTLSVAFTARIHIVRVKEHHMPRGDKSKYTDKQKRQAEKIEEGYESRGVAEGEAERRAWATVNKMTGGGRKAGGSGRGKKMNTGPAKKGGRLGGAASARRPAGER